MLRQVADGITHRLHVRREFLSLLCIIVCLGADRGLKILERLGSMLDRLRLLEEPLKVVLLLCRLGTLGLSQLRQSVLQHELMEVLELGL